MGTPLVSVLLTTYNHARFAEEALDSLAAQTFRDFEVVATDDFSTDESVDVVRSWIDAHDVPVSLVANKRNIGICAVRNQALARARGEVVCSLSGDDLFEPDRLARQSDALVSADADVAVVYSDVRTCEEDGHVRDDSYLDLLLHGDRPEGFVFTELQRRCFIAAPGVMVRRASIEAVGGYDESLLFEDWDMWLRLADKFRFSYLPGVVATHRLTRSGLSRRYGSEEWWRSVITIHRRWLSRDPEAARRSALWIRRAAVGLSQYDRRSALEAFDSVADVPTLDEDRIPWGLVRRALAVPGAGTGVGFMLDARRRTGSRREWSRWRDAD